METIAIASFAIRTSAVMFGVSIVLFMGTFVTDKCISFSNPEFGKRVVSRLAIAMFGFVAFGVFFVLVAANAGALSDPKSNSIEFYLQLSLPLVTGLVLLGGSVYQHITDRGKGADSERVFAPAEKQTRYEVAAQALMALGVWSMILAMLLPVAKQVTSEVGSRLLLPGFAVFVIGGVMHKMRTRYGRYRLLSIVLLCVLVLGCAFWSTRSR